MRSITYNSLIGNNSTIWKYWMFNTCRHFHRSLVKACPLPNWNSFLSANLCIWDLVAWVFLILFAYNYVPDAIFLSGVDGRLSLIHFACIGVTPPWLVTPRHKSRGAALKQAKWIKLDLSWCDQLGKALIIRVFDTWVYKPWGGRQTSPPKSSTPLQIAQ